MAESPNGAEDKECDDQNTGSRGSASIGEKEPIERNENQGGKEIQNVSPMHKLVGGERLSQERWRKDEESAGCGEKKNKPRIGSHGRLPPWMVMRLTPASPDAKSAARASLCFWRSE